MPHVPQSRLELRFEHLSSQQRVAIDDGWGGCSFADVAEQSRALANTLSDDPSASRRVGLLAPADRRWVIAFWAIIRAGCSVVPLTALYPPADNARLLRRAGVRTVFATAEHADLLRAEGFDVVELSQVEATPRPAADRGQTPRELPPWSAPSTHPAAEAREALLLFTSGTTGEPKLVPHSHQSVFDGVRVLAEAWGFSATDVLVHMLPLHHLHGICVALLQSYLSGASTRLLSRFEPQAVLDACAGASVVMGVPTQYHKLLAHLQAITVQARERGEANMSRLRLLTSGSAKLPESLGKRLQAITGQYPLERYGMTEVGIVLSNPLSGERRPGSCGQPLPGVRARIVDEAGTDVADGQSGELWIQAPSIFTGYDGGASDESFTDGYFRTGDTAVWTSDGFVQLLGRTSVDIIKSGGEKLSALEIEELLRRHDDVDDAAVVGLPDETWGEAATAAVIVRGTVEHTFGAQLRSWCKERTAPFKVPRRVIVIDDLPRNTLGKVNKPALIARLQQMGAPD